ncbi:MAG: hypothetical protein J7L15_07535 [Clostridiales bacterium]|nr:hypothetical protein [Clostridiales bacterium]
MKTEITEPIYQVYMECDWDMWDRQAIKLFKSRNEARTYALGLVDEAIKEMFEEDKEGQVNVVIERANDGKTFEVWYIIDGKLDFHYERGVKVMA